jgi:hypothetical protein
MTSFSLRAFKSRRLPLVAWLFAAMVPSVWAQKVPVCSTSPDVQAALDQIPALQPAHQSQYQWALARRTALQSLMRRYPGDVFVESAHITSMRLYESDAVKIVAEYRARHEQQPDDVHATYLYAMTLEGRDTPRAIKLFNEALDKNPNFFLPHLQLVTIYTSTVFLNKAEAISHEKSFLAACPTALDAFAALQQIDDKDWIAQSIPKLRQILEPRTDAAALRAYSTLWSLEFKARPPSEYDAARKQISATWPAFVH